MTAVLRQLFTDHPADVHETYAQHFRVALWFAGMLALAAGAAFLHALIPGLFKRTASNIVIQLHGRMTRRR
jgi:hypothetical protein